jgi:adenylate cyclase
LALAHYANGSYEEAVRWGRMSASENPQYTSNMRYLAAALAAIGALEEARKVAMNLVRQEPDFRLSVYRQTRQPFRDSEISTRYLQHLREAGLPE